MDFESIYLGSNPSMTLRQLDRVVKVIDLKSIGVTRTGSIPVADECVIGLMVRIQPFQG